MKKEKKNKWYIYPTNDESNDAIYNTMRNMGLSPKETAIKIDGRSQPAIDADPDLISFLAKSGTGFPLKFRVFWEDAVGTIREWMLHDRAVKKRAKTQLRKKIHRVPEKRPGTN
jgi:hypothetical protein